jgi:hypothetical protein
MALRVRLVTGLLAANALTGLLLTPMSIHNPGGLALNLLFSLLPLVLAYGIDRLSPVARNATLLYASLMVLSVVGFLGSKYRQLLLYFGHFYGAVGWLLVVRTILIPVAGVVILFLLTRPDIRAAFRPQPTIPPEQAHRDPAAPGSRPQPPVG